MKERTDAEKIWIINVALIIGPIVFSTAIYLIINKGNYLIANIVNNLVNNIVVVLFSIACSDAITGYQVKKQKQDKKVNSDFYFSLGVAFVAWTIFVILQTEENFCLGIVVAIVACIIIVKLIKTGITLNRKNDENQSEIIRSMHKNCEKIRGILLPQNMNKSLKSHVIRESDLLCNPKEFDRIEYILNHLQEKREDNE